MDVQEIAPRLWRWTGRHEEWEEDVGSVYYETEDGVVLVDPILPPEDEQRFLRHLDKEVHGQQVHVLVTVFWHTRDAAAMVERYGARVWAPARGKAAIARRAGTVTDAFRAGDQLPGDLQALPTARAAEVVYWIPRHGALVPGDVLLGEVVVGAHEKECLDRLRRRPHEGDEPRVAVRLHDAPVGIHPRRVDPVTRLDHPSPGDGYCERIHGRGA